MKPVVLVIDDDEPWRNKLRKLLEPKFDLILEETGEAALALLDAQQPELIVLDAQLKRGKLQGRDVLLRLKSDLALQRIPVLVLTGVIGADEPLNSWKADEYLNKAQYRSQLVPRIEHLLRRMATWPFVAAAEPTLSLFVTDRAPVDMVLGTIEFHERTEDDLRFNTDELRALGRAAYGSNWQLLTRTIGGQLYRLVMSHDEIQRAIGSGIAHARRVNVAGTSDLLDVPLEFLPDLSGRDYLVLHHPFSRSVLDVQPTGRPAPALSPVLLNELHRRGQPLRVLLIAANTGGIPRVEDEVDEIRRLFESQRARIPPRVKVLKTADATVEAVARELESVPYHIVHFAGHGDFVDQRTTEHRLVLSGARDITPGRPTHDGPGYLTKDQLLNLWSKHRPSLFYMSACQSAAMLARRDLINNDLLGMIDAALLAGVSSVIGFRWPVSDDGAYQLSTTFYDELLRTGRPDHALCIARRRVEFMNKADPAWLSPVLVMQPFHDPRSSGSNLAPGFG
ncbi:MAG TPA: CHAT domain-containing protein [Kofleriaceae bacterium]|jgi:DNA-binding response OmpR family regulator|nr:CHAT domain-containing protein [Kofleriaceae bacterium]